METLYVMGDPDFQKNLEEARNTSPVSVRLGIDVSCVVVKSGIQTS